MIQFPSPAPGHEYDEDTIMIPMYSLGLLKSMKDWEEKDRKNKLEAARRRLEGVKVVRFTDYEELNAGVVTVLGYFHDLAYKSSSDPSGWLRNLARSWGNQEGDIEAKQCYDKDIKGCVDAFVACERMGSVLGPEGLVRAAYLAMEVKALDTEKKKASFAFIQKAYEKSDDYCRIGNTILYLCYAINPKNLFGILILSMMGLTTDKIGSMSQDCINTLILFLTPSLGDHRGSISRLVPEPYANFIDTMVNDVFPTLEQALLYNIKYQYDNLCDEFKERFEKPKGGHEDWNFGIVLRQFDSDRSKEQRKVIHMPSNEVIRDDDAKNGDILSICKGRVHISIKEHEVDRCKEATKETYHKIVLWQKKFNFSSRSFAGGKHIEVDWVFPGKPAEPLLLEYQEYCQGPLPPGIIPQIAFWCGAAEMKVTINEPHPFAGVLSQRVIDKKATRDSLERVKTQEKADFEAEVNKSEVLLRQDKQSIAPFVDVIDDM